MSETAYNSNLRSAIVVALMPTPDTESMRLLPALPLLEIVYQYTIFHYSMHRVALARWFFFFLFVVPTDIGIVSTEAGAAMPAGGGVGDRGDDHAFDKRFRNPYRVGFFDNPKTGSRSLLLANSDMDTFAFKQLTAFGTNSSHAIFALFACLFTRLSGRLNTLIGADNGPWGFKNGPAHLSLFNGAVAICADPLNSNRFYLCDYYSVRVLDVSANGGAGGGIVTLIAGSGQNGYADGTNSYFSFLSPKFSGLTDMLCTGDGTMLIAADRYNHRIRSINTKTGAVTTIAGSRNMLTSNVLGVAECLGSPKGMCFDRSAGTKRDSVLFITSMKAVMRFDRQTGAMQARLCAPATDPITFGVPVPVRCRSPSLSESEAARLPARNRQFGEWHASGDL